MPLTCDAMVQILTQPKNALVKQFQHLFALAGFCLASYSIVGNDAIQTLGTFLSSNSKRPWWVLWIFACSILVSVIGTVAVLAARPPEVAGRIRRSTSSTAMAGSVERNRLVSVWPGRRMPRRAL